MTTTSFFSAALIAGVCSLMAISSSGEQAATPAKTPPPGRWIGIHLPAPSPDSLPLLKRVISEALAPMGVNVFIFEINYDYQFQSHPEVAGAHAWSKAQVRELVDVCRQHNIRLIPQLNCLGHQSWARNTGPLLAKHPELDETPLVPKDNTGIYCRSWCPLNPKTHDIVFDLIDELVDAF